MKYVQATIALGLFGWLGYGVYTGTLLVGDGGASRSRAVKGLVSSAVEQFGSTYTAIGLATVGIILATFFLLRNEEA